VWHMVVSNAHRPALARVSGGSWLPAGVDAIHRSGGELGQLRRHRALLQHIDRAGIYDTAATPLDPCAWITMSARRESSVTAASVLIMINQTGRRRLRSSAAQVSAYGSVTARPDGSRIFALWIQNTAGETFLCVHWVAVSKALRARRVNRHRPSAGGGKRDAAVHWVAVGADP
jgi:hypothetical protein